jgi:signal transduction histidine kinase
MELTTYSPDRYLPDEPLYRIAQEALNNALKHSGARNLSIQLTESEAAIALQIKDDGMGFDQAPGHSSGMGLHIMDYRARLIGGSLQLQSDGHGTIVSCRVPQNIR